MYQIIAYIKFLLRSTNEHGVHSPFVYNLLTCLYKKENKPAFQTLSAFRKTLLQDDRVINVKDFGAGSRVFKSDERRVNAIAKNAGMAHKRALLLNKLVEYLNIKNALELGTSVGFSSAAIAAGNSVNLITLEGCPQTAAIAKEYFDSFNIKNIEVQVGEFDSLLLKLIEQSEASKTNNIQHKTSNPQPKTNNQQHTTYNPHSTTYNQQHTPNNLQPTTYNQQPTTYNLQLTTDNQQPTTNNQQPPTNLIFFDGNHQKEATLKYFNMLLPLAHNDSVFIFDDIHWSKGMEEAWEQIKAHPRVTVSIDTFYWGIIFFRKEQEKEHFTIRL